MVPPFQGRLAWPQAGLGGARLTSGSRRAHIRSKSGHLSTASTFPRNAIDGGIAEFFSLSPFFSLFLRNRLLSLSSSALCVRPS